MLKKFIFIAITILISTAYFIGNYFVNFALKRTPVNDSPAADSHLNNPASASETLPSDLHEAWNVVSIDGLNLNAVHFIPNHQCHRYVILIHGYGCDQRYSWDYAPTYLQYDFDVVTPDLRACGMSEGMYLTMGVKESDDILIWIEKIIEHDEQAQIILHGVSMGAATALIAASKCDSQNLAAVISDCAYTRVYDIFCDQLVQIFNLPTFPIMDCVEIVSKLKTGVSISEAAPIDYVQNIRVPVLFIHGTADNLVPYHMMYQLYNNCGSNIKEKETFDDVAHASAKLADPNRYYNCIFQFLLQKTQS